MRVILAAIFCTILSSTAFSQGFKTSAEVGFFGGGSYYIGDLNPSKHFVYSKLAYGGIFRYNLSTRHSLRFNVTYGNIYGEDSKSSDPYRVDRNLSFKTQVLEFAFGVELDLFRYRINDMKYPISPYFFYQLAYTRINPKAELNGIDYALQPLATEGQGSGLTGTKNNRYKLNQFTVPLGIGLKFNLKKRIAISIEYGIRKTFTDYVDDVSGDYLDSDVITALNGPLAAEFSDRSLSEGSKAGINRGTSLNKDWYSFYGIMLTFKPFKKDVCDMRGWR
ncbi:MAG: hypothetical protein ACI8ZM_002242 [Crocinitomix sp.]|jgi:hypothetical protein